MLERLIWYAEITAEYIAQMFPCMFLVALLFYLLRPWRMKRLAGRRLTSTVQHEGLLLLFLMFCGGLAALTIFPARFWSTIYQGELPQWFKYPEKEFYFRITVLQEIVGGPWRSFMFLGNMVMFLPFGLCPPLLWNKFRWWHSILLACAVSTAIEILQLFVGRSSDINDIIINTCGGLVGFLLYRVIRRIRHDSTNKFKCIEVERIRENRTGN